MMRPVFRDLMTSVFGGVFKSQPGGAFTPAVLFASSEPGVWYDPSDLTTLFQDTAGTTPVTTPGQTVALMLDKSGNGLNATQPTTSRRPTYQVDAGGRGYLSFDGVDDWMVTPTITPGIDKVQIFVGVRKLSDVAGFGIIAEYGPPTAGTFSLTAPAAAGTDTYLWSSRGSIVIGTADSVSVSGYAAPITNILTSVGEISTDTMILRVDGAQAGSSSSNQGAGNYLAYPMYIGRRTGTSLPLNGQIYSLITRFGANLEVAQIESTEAYVAGKTGVTL